MANPVWEHQVPLSSLLSYVPKHRSTVIFPLNYHMILSSTSCVLLCVSAQYIPSLGQCVTHDKAIGTALGVAFSMTLKLTWPLAKYVREHLVILWHCDKASRHNMPKAKPFRRLVECCTTEVLLLLNCQVGPLKKFWELNFLCFRENKTCSKKTIARAFKWRGYTVGKVMGSWETSYVFKSCLEIMTFQQDPMNFPTVYPLHGRALSILFSEQVLFSL